MIEKIMLQKITNTMLISGGLLHVFCCALPASLAFSSLAAAIGLNINFDNTLSLHQYEGKLLTLCGILLAATLIAQFVSFRLDCVKQKTCSHPPCTPKKSSYNKVIFVSLALWLFNLVHFLTA
jgi:hypothetical protein